MNEMWELHNCFYIGSLNQRATSKLLGAPKLGFNYILKFYKSRIKIRLLNKETRKIFNSHKNIDNYLARITLTDLKSHQAKELEAQEHPNLMVALRSQPYMCSSCYSQAKMPLRSTKIFKPHVALVYCRERVFQW